MATLLEFLSLKFRFIFYAEVFLKTKWSLEVNQKRKCTIYRVFKEKYGFEKYLLELEFSERTALCNLRTGNHKLPITKTRYTHQDDDITCTLCDSNDICDEYHLLFLQVF